MSARIRTSENMLKTVKKLSESYNKNTGRETVIFGLGFLNDRQIAVS